MSIVEDTNTLVLQYLKDKYPGKYDDMTDEKLRQQPYHKVVWTHWEALAHFGMSNYYTSLDKAPEGLKIISVTEGEEIISYEWRNGKYVYQQKWTREFCKAVYGERTPGTY